MSAVEIDESIKAVYLTAQDINIAASLLYQAYHDDPLLQDILKADTHGPAAYEKKLRALIREELNSFWQGHQPLVGIMRGDTLKAVACLIKSDTELQPERYWHWRLKLMLSAGYLTTQQLIEKEKVIRQELAQFDDYYYLAFIAVAPGLQKQGFGRYLLRALNDLMANATTSSGIAVYVTREELAGLFSSEGYRCLKRLEFNHIQGQLLFKAK